jgi:hypothetical protein
MGVTAVVIGAVCATEGALRRSRPLWWGVAGAACVVAGTLLGGLAQTGLTVAPILAVLAAQTAPRTHEHHVHELHFGGSRHYNFLVGKLGIVLVAVLLPYAVVASLLVSAQRTATAQPTVVDEEQVTTYGSDYRDVGHLITVISYTFTVDGQQYTGKARHNWSADEIKSAKVCYDPSDIGGSHALELASYQCGSFDLHPSG